MTTIARAFLLAGIVAGIVSPASAQVSEMQIGGIASFGPGRMGEPNGGTVFGVSAGRLVYIGGRVTRYGETRRTPDSTITVTDQATALAVDLAIVLPAGPLEVMAGASIGMVHYGQRATPPTTNHHATEFLVAPGLSAEVHAGPLAFIPELQYQFSDRPDLPYTVRHSGWIASLRVVIPWEIGRIRT